MGGLIFVNKHFRLTPLFPFFVAKPPSEGFQDKLTKTKVLECIYCKHENQRIKN